jgi:hypothetical protein
MSGECKGCGSQCGECLCEAKKGATTAIDVHELQHTIWSNVPNHPATFAPCSRPCGSEYGARGGGVCICCAEKDLAKIVGAELAGQYVEAVRTIRRLESVMGEYE